VLFKSGKLACETGVVDVVVPPKVTEHTVETCQKLGITRVWMQPGSESEKAIKFCAVFACNIFFLRIQVL
jgi:predicted CoA-binding protein